MRLTKEEERDMWVKFGVWKTNNPKTKGVDYKGMLWMLVLFVVVFGLLLTM